MKLLISGLFVVLLTACSSPYTPTDKMLALKKNMSAEQAVQLLQSAIWGTTEPRGVCGARGFLYDKESNMKVQLEKISMLSHRRGKELKKISKGFNDVVVFEKQYYEYDFDHASVKQINIYDDPLRISVFPECNKSDSKKKYLIIDLFSDKKTNLKFTVYTEDFDKTMAAISIIFPTVSVIVK